MSWPVFWMPGLIFDVFFIVFWCLGPIWKDARQQIMNFGGTQTSRSLTRTRLVTKTMNGLNPPNVNQINYNSSFPSAAPVSKKSPNVLFGQHWGALGRHFWLDGFKSEPRDAPSAHLIPNVAQSGTLGHALWFLSPFLMPCIVLRIFALLLVPWCWHHFIFCFVVALNLCWVLHSILPLSP